MSEMDDWEDYDGWNEPEPDFDPDGDILRQQELDDFHNRPKPWTGGIGSLAADLALMQKGGMTKLQAD
jgi:hypothetical protein